MQRVCEACDGSVHSIRGHRNYQGFDVSLQLGRLALEVVEKQMFSWVQGRVVVYLLWLICVTVSGVDSGLGFMRRLR